MTERFPILDEQVLLSLPKANKPQDLRRMFTSPNSEDWMTWNAMRAILATGDNWWPDIMWFASGETPGPMPSVLMELSGDPEVDFWRLVPSPPAYERASRARMAASDSPAWRERAANPRAVEGSTEVDLVFDADDFLVFVEAKLHSDVSLRTTYDPDRNQMLRNIDCVIEAAEDRLPVFWMLANDRDSHHDYMRLINSYRAYPMMIRDLLPHRNPETLDSIVSTLAVLTWADLLAMIPSKGDLAEVREEVAVRVGDRTFDEAPR